MRGDFIVKFLTEIKNVVVDIGVGWSRIPYKGVRFSEFNSCGYSVKKKYYGYKNLQKRGVIKYVNDDQFVFTNKGQEWLKKSFIKYFKNRVGGKWDKKWRLVLFDIPEKMHKERVKFRQKIKSLGFVMVQKSVFIFPYPCEEEISDVANKLKVGDYVDLIIADSAGFKEKEFLKVFDL